MSKRQTVNEQFQLAMADPVHFRSLLRIDTGQGGKLLAEVMDPWQEHDFRVMDHSWRSVAEKPGRPPDFLRAWFERPRGHSKTSDLATMATWALFGSQRPLRGVVAAADRDQAALLKNAVVRLLHLNPWLDDVIDVQRYRVINYRTNSELEIISSDAATSYGLTPDFIICDELTHWKNDELWVSLLSSAAKRSNCLLLVITNAGWGETWQWDVRERIREDDSWYFHRLEQPEASWLRPEHLDEQRRLLPDVAYQRLWMNQWSLGAGDAFEEKDIVAALTLNRPPGVQAGWQYAMGLDIGLKRDATALVVIGKHVGWVERRRAHKKPKRDITTQFLVERGYIRDPGADEYQPVVHEGTNRLQLMHLDVWKPELGQVKLENVERAALECWRKYAPAGLAYDQWQAAYLAQRLQRKGVKCFPVAFQAKNLQEMARVTLDAFRDRQIALYDAPELLADLRGLRVVEKSWGFRLEPSDVGGAKGTRHGDAATAFSLALFLSRTLTSGKMAAGSRSIVLSPRPWEATERRQNFDDEARHRSKFPWDQ